MYGVIRREATSDFQLRSWVGKRTHHMNREITDQTYRFLSNLANVLSDSYTLRVLLEKLLRGSCIHIVHEKRVFGWNLSSKVFGHGVAYNDSQSLVEIM